MQKYQILIKLRSDLCVSDGGIYNSAIDTDVCYDKNGFPYIPAKRLKGCLREAALELKDWGHKLSPDKMFGCEGNQTGSIRIGNAYLINLSEYEALVNKYKGHMLLHPQNILGQFTYVRVQTSVDRETGTAEENSLRTIRVINKGCVFTAEVSMDDRQAMEEVQFHSLELCCRALRHMGISRTRGLGEVEVTLQKAADHEKDLKDADGLKDADESKIADGLKIADELKIADGEGEEPEEQKSDFLEYEIYLHEPVICKSVNGEEENTMDYIDGGKILGLLVKLCKERSEADFQKLLSEKNLKCSNAYLSDGKQRLVEVPASLYSVKNEKKLYADRSVPIPDGDDAPGEIRQLKPMKHCYVFRDLNGVLHTRSVELQESCHHRRPEDKSIGRACDEESGNSTFYQISSITPGQRFRGYVMASPDIIKIISQCIRENPDIMLGYGRIAEYGSASWQIIKTEEKKEIRKQAVREFMIKLESPAIIYSSNAAYTADWHILAEEIEACLNIRSDVVEERQKFINYTTVGGFQVTWGMRKPALEAFDKGTVLCYKCREAVEIPVGETIWLGERCAEGYGEATVTAIEKSEKRDYYCERITETQDSDVVTCNPDRIPDTNPEYPLKELSASESSFLWKLCMDKFEQYVYFTAGSNAWNDIQKPDWDKEVLKPTVSNLLLMCSESSSKQEVDLAARERFKKKAEGKKDKETSWNQINSCVCEQARELPGRFMNEYGVEDFHIDQELVEFFYLKEYLKQLKYALRHEKEGKDS